MPVKRSNPEALAAPLGLYSHVARVDGAGPVAIAGQLSVAADGSVVGAGDFRAQFAQVFENLRGALEGAGCGFADVLQFTSYVVDRDGIDGYYAARAEIFPRYFPGGSHPPNTLLIVDGLVKPEFLLEVQALAWRPGGGGSS